MGGKALSKPSVRLSKKEYFDLWDLISYKLQKLDWSHFDVDSTHGSEFNYLYNLIPSYEEKESHGDMDILINTNDPDYKQSICLYIEAVEMVSNGNVTSYGVKTEKGIFQIDFVFHSLEDYDYALNYYSFNDLNNLIGRVARKISSRNDKNSKTYGGFKHGHDGLWYILRESEDETRIISEILVSKEYFAAINFLGYMEYPNPKTKEDIFNYAISSKYSSFDIYDLKNRNNAARTRDSKRPIYTEFVQWLELNNNYTKNEFPDLHDTKLKEAFLIFDGFKERYDLALFNYGEKLKFRTKFNGEIIKKLIPGLEGKSLGAFISSFKKSRENKGDFINYINNLTSEEVEQQILWHVSIFNMEITKQTDSENK